MDNIIDEIFAIVDNDCRLALTKAGKEKITNLLKENVIDKNEMRKIAFDTPNDSELGNKIRGMFILGE
jgi:hypothetical protein